MRFPKKAFGFMAGLVVVVGWAEVARAADPHRLVEKGAVLLDVRSEEEFAEGHLPGAVNIPVFELPGRLEEVGIHSRHVVVYCASGERSAWAAKLMRANGFRHVYNMGAMSRWYRAHNGVREAHMAARSRVST
jgi:phage shock protein E